MGYSFMPPQLAFLLMECCCRSQKDSATYGHVHLIFQAYNLFIFSDENLTNNYCDVSGITYLCNKTSFSHNINKFYEL